jgi:hypothetical protein
MARIDQRTIGGKRASHLPGCPVVGAAVLHSKHMSPCHRGTPKSIRVPMTSTSA